MKICIIGAGWFGCYIGLKLNESGHQVTIYEKEKDIFLNSSGNNQNRLHLGFHYPRSKKTINISKKGFKIFTKNLNFLTKKIDQNIYSISSDKKSKISFKNYCNILNKSKLKFKILNKKNLISNKFYNLKGSILCEEKLILQDKAKKFFKNKLKNKFKFNKNINRIKKINKKFQIDNDEYDYVVDCTGFQLDANKKNKIIHEYCVIFLYKYKTPKKHPAITIMDGPFFTLYPWDEKNNFGLYSVVDSRLLKDKKFENLKKRSLKINKTYLKKIRSKTENKFSIYYPGFKKNFKFSKYLLSYRVISENKNDSRICEVINNNNLISVLPGKIDHIFYAYEKIKKCLKIY